MKKILMGNWKMALSEKQTLALLLDIKKKLKSTKELEVSVAPNPLFLLEARKILGKSSIALASQNVASQRSGSYTGETSAAMVKDAGCTYSIVGHSERRYKVNENNEMINKKINQCYHAGLVPVLCIGEREEEKLNNQQETVIVSQLRLALSKVDGLPENELVIAYEPVWAVGTGQFMEISDLMIVEKIIKRTISSMYSEKFYNEKVRLLYGGSVNSIIAKNYWNAEFLDGILVGGASLNVDEFKMIAEQS